MGRAHGEALRPEIERFVAQRLAAFEAYAAERGGADVQSFLDAGRACLDTLGSWDPSAHAEHCGTAEGAGIDAAKLYAIANMTDVRDVVLLPARDDEGCSALIVPSGLSKTGDVIAGQTWDLNPQDLDFIVAVHRKPAEGPETRSVTCVGCPTLVGMNENGVSMGTTNIKVRGSKVGVGYLSILHRAVRARSLREAALVIEEAPRAAAHTYWVADAGGAVEYECSADRFVVRTLEKDALVRTNHVFDSTHRAAEGEAPNSSSYARLKRLETELARGGHDVGSLRALYASRADGHDSISRHPEDETGTATNACILCVPAQRKMWACKGPSERGEWVELGFG